MNVECIIPARGGSQRIPRKNIKPFFGRPIIEYSIETALKSGLFYIVTVSTDDDEIADIAKKAGASVWRRPPCDGAMGTQEVAAMILREVWVTVDVGCVLYPTAPLLLPSDLHSGFEALKGRQFSMSVGDSPLRDAGAFYFGQKKAFCDSLPLIAPHTAMVALPENRVCDINTMEDWARAEQLYKENHERNR